MIDLALQILIDGFAISALYGLGAVGFTLMFGVCGVLNLAHGGIMVIAALFGWWVAANYGAGPYGGAAVGVIAGCVASFVTYYVVMRPIQRSRAIPKVEEEIFILTGTLLWGIMLQVGLDYLFSNNPVTMQPLLPGVVRIAGRAHAVERSDDRGAVLDRRSACCRCWSIARASASKSSPPRSIHAR